jgi:hypothetical protein
LNNDGDPVLDVYRPFLNIIDDSPFQTSLKNIESTSSDDAFQPSLNVDDNPFQPSSYVDDNPFRQPVPFFFERRRQPVSDDLFHLSATVPVSDVSQLFLNIIILLFETSSNIDNEDLFQRPVPAFFDCLISFE